MPVDGGMIPLPQPLLPYGPCRKRVVDRRGDIAREHAEEIEDDASRSPSVMVTEAPDKEDGTEDYTKDYSPGVAP